MPFSAHGYRLFNNASNNNDTNLVVYFYVEGLYGRVHALGIKQRDEACLQKALTGPTADLLSRGSSFIPAFSPSEDLFLQSYSTFVGARRTLESYDRLLRNLGYRPRHAPSLWNSFKDQFPGSLGPWQARHLPPEQFRYNLSRDESRALFLLSHSPDFLVLPADKNLGLCACGSFWYDEQITLHLGTRNLASHSYDQASVSEALEASKTITTFCSSLTRATRRCIRPFRYFDPPDRPTPLLAPRSAFLAETRATDGSWRRQPSRQKVTLSAEAQNVVEVLRLLSVPRFYLIPKLHKNPPKSRPIVAARNSFQLPLAVYLQKVFAKLTHLVDSHGIVCHSTVEAIRKIAKTRHSDETEQLFTADFTSLYTSLTHSTILSATEHLLKRAKIHPDLTRTLVQATQVLLNTCIFFEPRSMLIRKQTIGVPMGGAASGDIANCVLLHYELLQRDYCGWQSVAPRLYMRYIDDCFGLGTPASLEALLSSFPTDLPIVVEAWGPSVPFLDINVSLPKDVSLPLRTSLYEKGLSAYQYVLPTSGHRPNLSRGLIIGALTRLATICDNFDDFEHDCKILWCRLKSRGYRRIDWNVCRMSFIYEDKRREALGLSKLFPTTRLSCHDHAVYISKCLADPSFDLSDIVTVTDDDPRPQRNVIVHLMHNQFAPNSKDVTAFLRNIIDDDLGLGPTDYRTTTCWSNQRSLRSFFNRSSMGAFAAYQLEESSPPLPR